MFIKNKILIEKKTNINYRIDKIRYIIYSQRKYSKLM